MTIAPSTVPVVLVASATAIINTTYSQPKTTKYTLRTPCCRRLADQKLWIVSGLEATRPTLGENPCWSDPENLIFGGHNVTEELDWRHG